MTVEIFKGEGKQPWFVRLIYDNNQKANVSEGYVTKWNAKRAARRMFPDLPIVDLTAKDYRKFP